MKTEFNNLLAKRRSIYALGDNVKETPEDIYTLIKDTVRNSPTAFNSQTVRTVVLFGKASNKVWDIVEDRLKSEVPDEEAFAKTKEKIATFRAGFGTILFLTDTAIVEKLSASSCSLENTLSIIAGKWKSVIIYYLLQRKVCRFSELQKLIPDCSKRMLALQLKDLEKAKIINKKVYPVVPPKTEYSLTDLGKTLFPVIKAMDDWGANYHNS